jgi:hypothetical protein
LGKKRIAAGMTQHLGIISLFFIILQFSSSLSSPQHTSKDIIAGNHPKYQEEAFVTLIYSDDFVLPVRVLGHSLKKTETKRCGYFAHALPALQYVVQK